MLRKINFIQYIPKPFKFNKSYILQRTYDNFLGIQKPLKIKMKT